MTYHSPAKSTDSKRIDDRVASDFDNLVYHISHDFRASVRALRELPAWVLDDLGAAEVTVPDQVVEYFDLMRIQTDRLDQFLTALLTYARIGRMQTTSVVNFSRVATDALQEAVVAPGFEVSTHLSVPNFEMMEKDLHTLLVALLSNAVKHHFSTSGKIELSAKVLDNFVEITVTDDGPGIEPVFQDSVFGLMTTLKPRDQVEGSGLGLSIARKICETYGGSLTLTSIPDHLGCRFIARINMEKSSWSVDLSG